MLFAEYHCTLPRVRRSVPALAFERAAETPQWLAPR
jgi:hypothetical protein